jgi:toxin ParE1/3/4
MANSYTRSQKSKQDIQHIVKRSMADFGEQQTRKYMEGLKTALQNLADTPDRGRIFTHAKTDKIYSFHKYVSHVIYYRQRKNDIFIVRILHKKMLPEKHI